MRYPNWAPRISILTAALILLLLPAVGYLLTTAGLLDQTGVYVLILVGGLLAILLRDGIVRRAYQMRLRGSLRFRGNLDKLHTRADGTSTNYPDEGPASWWRETVALIVILGLVVLAIAVRQ